MYRDPIKNLALARRLASLVIGELSDDADVEIAHDSDGNLFVSATVVAPAYVKAIRVSVSVGGVPEQ